MTYNPRIAKINERNREFWDKRTNRISNIISEARIPEPLPPAEKSDSPLKETKSLILSLGRKGGKTSSLYIQDNAFLKTTKEQPKKEVEIKITRPKRKFNLGE
jgi:hypothetical protein